MRAPRSLVGQHQIVVLICVPTFGRPRGLLSLRVYHILGLPDQSIRFVLGGPTALSETSHQLLIDFSKIEFLSLTIVHKHKVRGRLIQIEAEFFGFLRVFGL